MSKIRTIGERVDEKIQQLKEALISEREKVSYLQYQNQELTGGEAWQDVLREKWELSATTEYLMHLCQENGVAVEPVEEIVAAKGNGDPLRRGVWLTRHGDVAAICPKCGGDDTEHVHDQNVESGIEASYSCVECEGLFSGLLAAQPAAERPEDGREE